MTFSNNDTRKIGVFRALQLGDMLCIIPAMRTLRNSYPDAEITLFGLPWASALISWYPAYFDRFRSFPGFPGLPEQKFDPRRFSHFLHEVIEEKFDLVFQMQGNGSIVNPMIELFGAKNSAGFYLKDDYCPDPRSYLHYPSGIHEIERHLALMINLGMDSCGSALEFPVVQDDFEKLGEKNLLFEPGKYVCVHPGSRGIYRQWPPEYFAALADFCSEQGFTVVLTGTVDEKPIIEEVIQNMESDPVVAAGKTAIGEVAALISNAAVLVSNCTGVSHIAAALETPSIVISMDGEPERWGPINKSLHRTIDWTKTPEFNVVFAELKNLLFNSPQGEHFRNASMLSGENLVHRI